MNSLNENQFSINGLAGLVLVVVLFINIVPDKVSVDKADTFYKKGYCEAALGMYTNKDSQEVLKRVLFSHDIKSSTPENLSLIEQEISRQFEYPRVQSGRIWVHSPVKKAGNYVLEISGLDIQNWELETLTKQSVLPSLNELTGKLAYFSLGRIWLADAATGTVIKSFGSLPGLEDSGGKLAFSSDGTQLGLWSPAVGVWKIWAIYPEKVKS